MFDLLFDNPAGKLTIDDFSDVNAVALNITNSIDSLQCKCGEIVSAHVLAAAQESWRMNAARASKIELVLAYCKRGDERLVLGAFTIGRWDTTKDGKRMMFWGYPSPNRNKYEYHLLPKEADGARNPVKYYD